MMLYDVIWCFMMLYDVLWCSMIFFDVLWCFMMFYDVLWCLKSILGFFLSERTSGVSPVIFTLEIRNGWKGIEKWQCGREWWRTAWSILLKVSPSKKPIFTRLWKTMPSGPVWTIWEWSSALTARTRPQGSLEKEALTLGMINCSV